MASLLDRLNQQQQYSGNATLRSKIDANQPSAKVRLGTAQPNPEPLR